MTERLWSETTAPIFAAIGGAVVGALALEVTPLRAVTMAFAGGLSGAFIMPGIAEYAGVESVNAISALSFLGGMFALQFARLVQRRFDALGSRALDAAMKRVGVEPPTGDVP